MKISDFTLVIDNITVDTLPLFIQLAADTTTAYKEIDSLYETDKTRYQIAASHSPFTDHPLFTTGGIERQIYASKYLGIVLAAIEDGRGSPLFKQALTIMGKRWNELYCYIQKCETIDLSEAAKPEYYAESLKNVQTHKLLTGAAIQYIQYFNELYPAIDLPLHSSLKFAMFMACAFGQKIIVSSSETLSIIQIFGGKFDSTDQFQQFKGRLNKSVVKKLARYLKNVIYQKVFLNYLDPWNGDRFWEGLAHCTAYLSATVGISLLSPKLLSQIKERDIELLCRLYIVKMTAEAFRSGELKKNKEAMELDCVEFVMFGLNLLDFIREYKKAKKLYFEHNATHLYAEIDNLKRQLQSRETEIRSLSRDLTAKNNLLALKEEEINTLVLKQKFVLNVLIKENEQLKTKIAQTDKIKDTTTDAKTIQCNYIAPIPSKPLDTETSLKMLENIHAIIIGGAESWQAKLKSKLPHFDYLNGDVGSFDHALIIHADIVFANVRCKFSHDCFYKMIKLVRQHEKRLVYLPKTNIALTIRMMASAVDSTYIPEENSMEHSNIGCAAEL
ncbi:hypothetical protein [Sporomusa malonica]|uniref:DUF2325 domain-containing protein n=1 Tax=Sporomusa malonica TaxID=112901 RepID=A0A1W2DS07_9FIRM|nr:hypothetical protein [Sporomusa malonica]SMC99898.1 hypothetical protein SAMN04488500_117112 [Sporomusa malonica]